MNKRADDDLQRATQALLDNPAKLLRAAQTLRDAMYPVTDRTELQRGALNLFNSLVEVEHFALNIEKIEGGEVVARTVLTIIEELFGKVAPLMHAEDNDRYE